MTPLHELLVEAIVRARGLRPELTEAEIARAAGLHPQALWRAKQACREGTLAAVLAAVHDLTGVRLDVGLKEAV